jgi:acylphosphatase
VVHGRVQGVSFRYYARHAAERLGVSGWVRNQPDGSVALHAEGGADAVERFVEWCQHGPPAAVVRRVDETPTVPTGSPRFEIRR